MNALECKAYLERIGYQEEPHVDKDCLKKLMELQLQRVPFENLEAFKEKRFRPSKPRTSSKRSSTKNGADAVLS